MPIPADTHPLTPITCKSLQMAEAEQQFVHTSQRVRKEFESRLEEVRRAGEEDVHLRMDAGTKRIMQQNRSLQEELHIHLEVLLNSLSCSACIVKFAAVTHCDQIWHAYK